MSLQIFAGTLAFLLFFRVLRGLAHYKRKQTTSRPDNVWPDMWKHVSDAAKEAKRSINWQSRNQSSIMPVNFVVSSSSNKMMILSLHEKRS